MSAVNTYFKYPLDSNVYYIGKGQSLQNRIPGKMRADYLANEINRNPRVMSTDEQDTFYHYITSTYYDHFETELRFFSIGPDLQEFTKEIEDILIASFHLKFGSKPLANKKAARRDIWAISEFRDLLIKIGNIIF
ncbi:hypothetical protein [Flammeovirga aprica]|uniref:Uncharacterized protein n=1 Tax=Flammeovirga aprica JL-4 TaxID=694437 RepID=A0A7X9XCW0_9BACT|nr:hypothetical protein [Flammeovirga aprica]NME72148.1 hypothetical protein [Flammeovirga aprica JL-4]